MKRFESINPCIDCVQKECGFVDGQECKKCKDFLSLKGEFEKMKSE